MAPVPVPDAALFVSGFPVVAGDIVEILPRETAGANGLWSYNDLKYATEQGAAEIHLAPGTYYLPYHWQITDPIPTFKLRGAGRDATRIVSGTPTAPIQPLDATDRPIFNPSAVSNIISTYAPNLDHIGLDIDGIDLQCSSAPGHRAEMEASVVLNAEVFAMLAICGRWPVLSENAVPVALAGVAPTALGTPGPLVDNNLAGAPLIEVWQGDNSTGVLYVEGVDYTINNGVAPSIQRTPGSAIADPSTVYVNYNDLANRLDIPRIDVIIGGDMRFTGRYRKIAGVLYANQFAGFMVLKGSSFARNLDDVFHNIVYTDIGLPYSDLRYGREGPFDLAFDSGQPALPTNTNLVMKPGAEYVEVSAPIWIESDEGVQTPAGPYTFLPGTVARPVISIGARTEKNCGLDFFAWFGEFIEEVAGCSISVANGLALNSFGMTAYAGGQQYGEVRLPTWVGEPCNVLIAGNTGYLNPPFLFPVGFPGAIIAGQTFDSILFAFGATAEDALVVSGNHIEYLETAASGRYGVQVDRQIDAKISGNTFVNPALGSAAEDAILVRSRSGVAPLVSGVQVSGNDFSKWRKALDAAEVNLTADTEECSVQVSPNDTVRDDGANNTILGTEWVI